MIAITTPELFRFFTDDFPERDRLAMWREVLGRRIVRAEFETLDGTRFFHKTTFRNFNGLSFGFSAAANFRGTRTRPLVHDGNDDLMLTVTTEGSAHSAQFGREARAEACEGAMLCCGEWAQFTVPERAQFTIIAVPHRPIATMVKDPEAKAGRVLGRDNEALRLLSGYVALADNGIDFADREARQLFISHIYDLTALTLGTDGDAAVLAQSRGLRAARLGAIKADILARLGDERLSIASIAKAHGVTARYVQMLFEADGTTFSEYVLEQRVNHAHRMLSDQRHAARTISAVAFEAGFSNLSYFNRVFRRRFGATPSDIRAAAQRERG